MLEEYGFISPRSEIAADADQAARAAGRIGFPVVLKIESSDIVHKTDVGGVAVGVESDAQARDAFERIMLSVKTRVPEARVEGVRVQEMIQAGIEIIIGLNNDAQFGPTIMFGLGGVLTEVLQDVSFRVLPISREDAAGMVDEIRGRRILDGFRGQPAVSRDMLIDLLLSAARLGLDLGPELDSIDFNPILVWGDQHRAIDVKILRRAGQPAAASIEPNVRHIDGFFTARSVALVGASASKGKIGNTVLESLMNPAWGGKVYPINPMRNEIMGVKTYATLSAIPDPIDMVVVTAGLSTVPDLLQECHRLQIHNMVVISAGGKEVGGEGVDLEMDIQRLARQLDVRIVGCNCIGLTNAETRMDTFFQSRDRMLRPPFGPVAMLSQSGTIAIGFLEDICSAGLSKLVSYGNRIDVDEADLLTYLEQDQKTRVIAMYIEGLKDGRKFLQAARRVSKSKPVVVFKTGRTQAAARASVSHTGFFGGSYAVYAGAFRQAGLVAVDSYGELVAAAKALAMQPRAKGPGIAMISNGAGSMVQGIDLMPEFGLVMRPLAQASVDRLRPNYPSFYVIQNPIDVTGSASSEDYRLGIEALMDDENTDIIMPWFVFQNSPLDDAIVDVLGRFSSLRRKPIVCGAFGGPYTHDVASRIEERRVPVFFSVREWMAAAAALVQR